jgi:hypothetical protein
LQAIPAKTVNPTRKFPILALIKSPAPILPGLPRELPSTLISRRPLPQDLDCFFGYLHIFSPSHTGISSHSPNIPPQPNIAFIVVFESKTVSLPPDPP